MFDVDFFEDEVRNGFYISSEIKQAWAAQLQVLFCIDKICKKHDITYFADWGTLLSAIRHGGYIPWDDDLDICMKREDYNKFREVADKELPENFAIHDYERQKDHWLFITKIVNTNHISYEEKHLRKYHNFPYIACVDIFVIDYLYDDIDKEEKRIDAIKHLLAVADGILEEKFNVSKMHSLLDEIESEYGVEINNRADRRAMGIIIYRLIERIMSAVKESEAKKVGQIFPWVLKGFKGYPKEYYEKSINVPYEGFAMPVPAAYDAVLTAKYGQYLNAVKGTSTHEYPFFEGQKREFIAVGGIDYSEYKFDKADLQKLLNEYDKKDAVSNNMISAIDDEGTESIKELVGECLEQLRVLQNNVELAYDKRDYEYAKSLLPNCQSIAIDLGTLVDEALGEGMKFVDSLGEYCEALFRLFENIEDDSLFKNLITTFDAVYSMAYDDVINREIVIIMCCGAKNWKRFSSIYNEETKKNNIVYVVDVPVYYKDVFGNLTDAHRSQNVIYPGCVSLSGMTLANISLLHPSRIYYMDSYENKNPVISVYPEFYAKHIKEYTDKLIFVEDPSLKDFATDAICEMYNLKKHICKPGILSADKILVPSESIKDRYVDVLTEFCGEETKRIWEARVFVRAEVDGENYCEAKSGCEEKLDEKFGLGDEGNFGCTKKKLIYCLGLNDLTESPDTVISNIKERLSIFEENSDRVDVVVKFYPDDLGEWKKINEAMTEEILTLVEGYFKGEEGNAAASGYSDDSGVAAFAYGGAIEDCDAYYGAASEYILSFADNKKPVMVSMKRRVKFL